MKAAALSAVALILLAGCLSTGPEAAAPAATATTVTIDGLTLEVRRTAYFRPVGVAPQMADGSVAARIPAHEGPDGAPAVAVRGLPLAPDSWERAERAAALACGADLLALGYDPDLGGVRPDGSDEIVLQLPRCPGLGG